jgi:hypothetical protein
MTALPAEHETSSNATENGIHRAKALAVGECGLPWRAVPAEVAAGSDSHCDICTVVHLLPNRPNHARQFVRGVPLVDVTR